MGKIQNLNKIETLDIFVSPNVIPPSRVHSVHMSLTLSIFCSCPLTEVFYFTYFIYVYLFHFFLYSFCLQLGVINVNDCAV